MSRGPDAFAGWAWASFIGLGEDQAEPFRKHILDKGIHTLRVQWGRPTLVVKDLDGNELYIWVPHDDVSHFATAAIASPDITGGA